MALPLGSDIEQVSSNNSGGCIAPGLHREVISGVGNTTVAYVLKPEQSGSLCLFDAVDGVVYQLPAPVVGMQFSFLVIATGTSNAYTINTDAATTFIGGGIQGNSTTAGGADSFPATIASTVSCDLDSAETGWLIGGYITITCLSSTTWGIQGQTSGSGTLATPFA